MGGGLYNAGLISLLNCTFSMCGVGNTNGTTGNGKNQGGNIANAATKKNGGTFFLENSIIGKTSAGASSFGPITDKGFNIVADNSIKLKKGSTSRARLDPRVGSLADNGGPTKTVGLFTNSPAVDAIPTDNQILLVDQRGITRPQIVFSNGLDIGAFELDTNLVTILVQPRSTNATVGSNVTFSVVAQGTAPLFYQWLFNSTNIPGANDSTLSITNVQQTNAGSYRVVVTNFHSAVTSAVAVLTVGLAPTNSAPVITNQPADQMTTVGGAATFTVGATGTQPLFFQWFFKNLQSLSVTNIPGATTNVLSLINVQSNIVGGYFAVVTNAFGATTSSVAVLVLTNASTNTSVDNPPPTPGSLQRAAIRSPGQMSTAPFPFQQTDGPPMAINFTSGRWNWTTSTKRFRSDFGRVIPTNTGERRLVRNKAFVRDAPPGRFAGYFAGTFS
jgi:hypothetical protein